MAQILNGITISQHVGGYLKRQLRERNTTQEEFASQIGVDPRTVRRWVSDGIHSLDVLVEIADFLGVNVRDIFLDEDGVPFLFKYVGGNEHPGVRARPPYSFFNLK